MKMTLFIDVFCSNSFASNIPSTLVIVLDDGLFNRIESLKEAVVSTGAFAIDEFVSAGTWSLAPIALAGVQQGSKRNQDVIDAFEAEALDVELAMLRVTSTGFEFKAVLPISSGEDLPLVSQKVHFHILDRAIGETLVVEQAGARLALSA